MSESPLLSRLGADARQVIVSVNPKAGRRDARPKVEALAGLLRARGLVTTVLTDLAEVTAQAVAHHTRSELRAVVAAGGDGTIAEIVNRLPSGLPVTTLPLGTENLLAKYLGIGRDVESLCETIVEGAIARLDAGLAVSQSPSEQQPVERIFLLMASAGLDADVIRRLAESRRGHISHLSYARPIFAAFREYPYPELRIRLDGVETAANEAPASPSERAEIVARWMFLFNLPCYARGIPFTPRARGDDGRFDLCTFQRGSLWHALRYLWAVIRGRHDRHAECSLRRLTGIRVEAAATSGPPIPFQLDGDFGGFLPLEVKLLRERLTLLVPSAWLDRQSSSV